MGESARPFAAAMRRPAWLWLSSAVSGWVSSWAMPEAISPMLLMRSAWASFVSCWRSASRRKAASAASRASAASCRCRRSERTSARPASDTAAKSAKGSGGTSCAGVTFLCRESRSGWVSLTIGASKATVRAKGVAAGGFAPASSSGPCAVESVSTAQRGSSSPSTSFAPSMSRLTAIVSFIRFISR